MVYKSALFNAFGDSKLPVRRSEEQGEDHVRPRVDRLWSSGTTQSETETSRDEITHGIQSIHNSSSERQLGGRYGNSAPVTDVPIQTQDKGREKEKKRMFGLAQEGQPAYVVPDDYEQRYPPDDFGQEMGPNARVWRVYLDEAELNDRDMIEGWKNGIDVLLVFAGLFSAVVTTFVAQTSQKLDQDFGQISASLLSELIAIQRSVAAGSSLDDIAPSDLNLSSPPYFTAADAWVNGLWFTSLALSLVTALYSVLVKQWIQHYVSFISGTPQERARIHHFRYMGIQHWSVPGIIGVLPVFLYMALFLFILGLVIFLQALKPEIACIIGAIGSVAFVLYAATNFLPLFYPQCPYRTPLIEHVRSVVHLGLFTCRQAILPLIRRAIPQSLTQDWTTAFHSGPLSFLEGWYDKILMATPPSHELAVFKAFEFMAALDMQDEVVSEIIRWLLISSSNPTVKPIALQSISGLRFGFAHVDTLLEEGSLVRQELLAEVFRQYGRSDGFTTPDYQLIIGSPPFYAAERTIRASMFVPNRHRDGFDALTVWKPVNRHHLQTYTKNQDQHSALQMALITYMVQHAAYDQSTASEVIPVLFDILSTADKYPMAWSAWFKGLHFTADALKFANPTLAGAYTQLKPLFDTLLSWNCSITAWAPILPFVFKTLPSHIVEGHHNLLEQPYIATGDALKLRKFEFRAMLLKGVIVECRSSPNGVMELEELVRRAIDDEDLIFDDLGRLANPMVEALDEILSQPFFINNSWSSQTYRRLFAAYVAIPGSTRRTHPPTSAPPRMSIPLQRLSDVLRNKECTSGLLQFICSPFYHNERGRRSLLRQIMPLLDGLAASDPSSGDIIANICMAFEFLGQMPGSSAPPKGPSELERQWTPSVQPLVRWIIMQILADNGTENVRSNCAVQTLANRLMERPQFLTFACSSFLVYFHWPPTPVVFSKESLILLQLADYHKNKPGAAEAWRQCFSWTVAQSAKIIDNGFRMRGEADFERYARMADFVDQLMGTLGMDDPGLRIPQFEKGHVIELLNAIHYEPSIPQLADHASADSTRAAGGKRSTFRNLLPWKACSEAEDDQQEKLENSLELNHHAVV